MIPREKNFKQLHQKVVANLSEIVTLKEQVREMQKEKEKLKEALDKIKAKADELTVKVKETEERVRNYSNENANLKKDLAMREEENKKLRVELQHLRGDRI
jgi:regulator of replication initiation timing